MTSLLIKNGHVIDPANKIDGVSDIYIEDGKIKEIGKGLKVKADKEIDAKGKIVTPGLVDMHVHLREPGREDKETLETGLRAALHGGVTSVLSMPNTNPQAHDQTVVEFQLSRAAKLDLANLFVAGRTTKKEKKIAEMWELKDAGAIAVTDDGWDVDDERLLLSAMEWAFTFDLPVITHAEMSSLSKGGVMHEGKISQLLGLEGQPRSAEVLAIEKSLLLAEEAGVQIHIQHISTAAGVESIRQAKARGVRASAEATPQHIGLTHDVCLGWNTNAKMHPPIREEEDRQAILKGLKDGTIDCIATDHAPHLYSEKLQPFKIAPVGTTGLETMFAAVYTSLVKTKVLTLSELIERLTVAPSKILRIEKGTLSKGADADISIFDIDTEWTVDSTTFETKGLNSVFEGMKLTGKADTVVVGGVVKVSDGNVL